MNKYQEALDEMCCGCYASCSKDGKPCLAYMKLQELVDKSKPKEAIKGKIIPNSFEDIQTYYCKCGRELSFKDNYCGKCGQKLKWDEK